MKSTRNHSDTSVQHLEIRIDKTAFVIYGGWKSQSLEKLSTKADLDLSLSFDSKVIIDKTSLIHPDDIARVEKILSSAKHREQVDYNFRIITANLEVQLLRGTGIVESSKESQADLLKATMDSSADMIQVFKAVRNKQGEIIDFVWILNNHASEKIYGDVIGKSLLENNPGVVEVGIFDTFKNVVETGSPDRSERHYVHEQFNGWFMQSTVKLNDGVATTTTDITYLKEIEHQLEKSKEQLQATLDSSPYIVQAFEAVRKNQKIIDFRWVFNNRHAVKQNGDVIGKSMLAQNPGVVDSGLFNQFVSVTETGKYIDQEVFYDYEQFNAWYRQTLVKMGDGFVMTTEDISSRKMTEIELRESKNTIDKIATTTPDLITIQDAHTNRLTYVNNDNFWKALLDGVDVHNLPEPDRAAVMIHPDDLEKSKIFLKDRRSLKDGELKEIQLRLINGNWIGIRSKVFKRDDHGNASEIISFTSNITASKIAEQQMHKTMNLLQTVFDVSLNPIAYHKAVRDESGNIIDFAFQLENLEARKYAIEDRTGQRYSEACPGIKDTVVFKMYCDVVNTGKQLNQEVQLSLKDAEHWFQLMAAKLGDGLVATAVDITERKKDEQEILRLKDEVARKATDKYRALFNSIDQGFNVIELIFDNNGKVIDYWQREYNPVFTKLTGLKDAIGKKMRTLVPYIEPEWYQMVENIYYTGKPIQVEYPVQALGKWFRAYMSRVGGEGSPLVACVYDDITERKQREQQQQFLLKFSDALRSEPNADAVAHCAIQMLIEHLRLDSCYVTTYYLDKDIATVDYQMGNETVPRLPEYFQLSHYSDAFKTVLEKSFVVEDALDGQGLSEEVQRNSAKLGMRAMVGATVRKENRPLWSMAAISSTPRHWTSTEIALVEEIAERTWNALERVKVDAALRESEEKYRTIFQTIDEGFTIQQLLMDEKGNVTDLIYQEVNEAYEKHLGVKNAAGKKASQLYPHLERYWLENLALVQTTGTPLRVEGYNVDLDHRTLCTNRWAGKSTYFCRI